VPVDPAGQPEQATTLMVRQGQRAADLPSEPTPQQEVAAAVEPVMPLLPLAVVLVGRVLSQGRPVLAVALAAAQPPAEEALLRWQVVVAVALAV
jgi:hypothetical protein